MLSIRSAAPYLFQSTPQFFPLGVRRIPLRSTQLMKFPAGLTHHPTRVVFGARYVHSDNIVNRMGKLSLSLLFGGVFLASSFSYVKALGASSVVQQTDEKSLSRYFELLDNYPKLKREGELNSHENGTYEIIYDRKEILSVKKEVYERLYSKSKLQGLTHAQADELASDFSRIGVVGEDQFWLWIRDAVISPQGYRHTYNRIVWKCGLDRIGGAAVLPILIENGTKKIVLQLVFRHATNSWQIELPRGNSRGNETALDTAKREILEETGYETTDLLLLGSITPDSGVIATVAPIFTGQVVVQTETKHDKTEAIKAKYAFTLSEIMTGLKQGYMEVEINQKITQVPIRDPFLAYALLMAQHGGIL